MKFNCGFSIFILLFILPSSIFAVRCTINIARKDDLTVESKGSRKCDACVYFLCMVENRRSFDISGAAGEGCPEDFYRECSKFSSDINFIRHKSPRRLDYAHVIKNNDTVSQVAYVSGCGNEMDGTKCMEEQYERSTKDAIAKQGNDEYRDGFFYWNDGKDSHIGKSFEGNSSINQNGAFKFIGLITIGWIIAAWYY